MNKPLSKMTPKEKVQAALDGPMNKPPLLTDDAYYRAIRIQNIHEVDITDIPTIERNQALAAQRDADYEWHKERVREIFGEIEKYIINDPDSMSHGFINMNHVGLQQIKSRYLEE